MKAIVQIPRRSYLLKCLTYDPATGILTWLPRPTSHFISSVRCRQWNTRYAGKLAGCVGKRPGPLVYKTIQVISIDDQKYIVSRVIWKMVTGRDPRHEIDHINGDSSDNRLENLREATRKQNARNTRGFSRTGLPKGVYRHHDGVRFKASICTERVQVHLGVFDTPTQAHAAYCAAAKKLFGRFANGTRATVPHQNRIPPGASS